MGVSAAEQIIGEVAWHRRLFSPKLIYLSGFESPNLEHTQPSKEHPTYNPFERCKAPVVQARMVRRENGS